MWVTTLTYDLDLTEDEHDRLADQLDELDAGLANIPDHGLDVTYWTDAAGPLEAARVARDHVSGVMDGEPVGVEVVDASTHERRADAPTLPRLVSAPEVAEMLGGVSRQRVHQLRAHKSFPAPVFELKTGPIWDARAIERFARDWARKPGRPAKTAG
ncbi:MAG: helix-turn-helix transcriptional regulator [Nocardioides sp.]